MQLSGQLHARAFYPEGKSPSTQSVRGWVVLRVGMDTVAKRKSPYPFRESNPGRPVHRSVTLCPLFMTSFITFRYPSEMIVVFFSRVQTFADKYWHNPTAKDGFFSGKSHSLLSSINRQHCNLKTFRVKLFLAVLLVELHVMSVKTFNHFFFFFFLDGSAVQCGPSPP
jgi:hypothetical protein